MKPSDVEAITKSIEKLAEQYATDKDGQFDLNAYIAFKAGFDRAFDICLQMFRQSDKEDQH